MISHFRTVIKLNYVLAKRYNEQSELMKKATFGTSKSDYLLFDGLDKNLFYRLLTEAYGKSKFKPK